MRPSLAAVYRDDYITGGFSDPGYLTVGQMRGVLEMEADLMGYLLSDPSLGVVLTTLIQEAIHSWALPLLEVREREAHSGLPNEGLDILTLGL
jgi:hypothetical protein